MTQSENVAMGSGTIDASSGVGLRVRMYRVGFGDFFLLSVPHGGESLHILIDCGVHQVDIESMGDAVSDMAKECGGRLALVVMTHRHADHISGFAKCAEIFETITVEAVWMPWFENPNEKEAARAQAGLAQMAAKLGASFAKRDFSAAGVKTLDRVQSMAANADGGKNGKALQVLNGGFADRKAKYSYYKAGDLAKLPVSLQAAGLAAEILGPPGDVRLLTKMNKASQEYLTGDDDEEQDAGFSAFNAIFHVEAKACDPKAFKYVGANKLRSLFLDFQFSALAASATNLDNYMNNQSLVILFRFKGKSLLFVGDAQWGNWRNFLYGPEGEANIRPEAKDILNSLDFYKIGHHGSANATPVDAVKLMRPGCACMCSTELNAYNEVPRSPLLDAFRAQKKSPIARSDQVAAGTEPAEPGAGALDALFTAPAGKLYIDYHL
jgi:beta-lactamase superfamily II metal-dependent hydrolase